METMFMQNFGGQTNYYGIFESGLLQLLIECKQYFFVYTKCLKMSSKLIIISLD